METRDEHWPGTDLLDSLVPATTGIISWNTITFKLQMEETSKQT